MSEVAADTPDGRRRRQQKLTARIPAKPWGGSLAEIHKGTTGDDSPIVVRQAQPRYDRASAIWTRARFMARGNIIRDPAVADDSEGGLKLWIVHIDCLRVASRLPDLLCSSG